MRKAARMPEKERAAEPERIFASAEQGLTAVQVECRQREGFTNEQEAPPTRTVGQIVRSNLLTYFNLVFFVLAGCIIAVRSYNDLMFMPIIIANIIIGTIQEIRSKRILDRLTILSSPKAQVVRDGAVQAVPLENLVLDDVVVFAPGNQIGADGIVLSGEIQVNEALVTGESNEILKKAGDVLLSGSYVVSGSCRARLDKVGKDSFVSRLTIAAKAEKKRVRSEMMRSLTLLVQVISFILIPLGGILFYNQYFHLKLPIEQSVISTVAALIGMIPEGLYLLVSVALAVSVMRLSKHKTLVHEMGCIESLARVDVLCVDKTGTITEPKMLVSDIVLLCPERFDREDIHMIMTDYAASMGRDNETMAAVCDYFSGSGTQAADEVLPFSPALKYSGVSFGEGSAYILGAPEFILLDRFAAYKSKIEPYLEQGQRVLLLALYDGDLKQRGIHAEVMPLALVLLTNKIRETAPETFRFFAGQGVSIKVISGDNPVAVSTIAAQAGIENAHLQVDATTLDTDEKIQSAASEYAVFGRVTPEQKRKLIQAIKKAGHTVAMTGDGVNDILALKEADCSIAMASGSEVATHVSQLVLLDSDFSALPAVVMEGRRVINNIERAASLFLVKNIFSFFLSIITIFAAIPYPVEPSHLSMVSALTIGLPSFFLALEPNQNIVTGRFLRNVLFRAFPAGLTNVILVLGVILFSRVFSLPSKEMATISALVLGVVGLLMLFRVCQPFTRLRKQMWVCMTVGFIGAASLLETLFGLTRLSKGSSMVFVVFALLAHPFMGYLSSGLNWLSSLWRKLMPGTRLMRHRTPRAGDRR